MTGHTLLLYPSSDRRHTSPKTVVNRWLQLISSHGYPPPSHEHLRRPPRSTRSVTRWQLATSTYNRTCPPVTAHTLGPPAMDIKRLQKHAIKQHKRTTHVMTWVLTTGLTPVTTRLAFAPLTTRLHILENGSPIATSHRDDGDTVQRQHDDSSIMYIGCLTCSTFVAAQLSVPQESVP